MRHTSHQRIAIGMISIEVDITTSTECPFKFLSMPKKLKRKLQESEDEQWRRVKLSVPDSSSCSDRFVCEAVSQSRGVFDGWETRDSTLTLKKILNENKVGIQIKIVS